MKIEIFALCDAATDMMGKLNLLGTFDTIFFREVPAQWPQCAVALRLRFNRIERGDHRIRLDIVDEDGKSVGPTLDSSLPVNFPDNIESVPFNVVLNLQGLKFQHYGRYSIDLALDSRQEASLPLFVRQPPPMPGEAPKGQASSGAVPPAP